MPLNNIPPDSDGMIALIVMFIMSIWGGMINYLARWKSGAVKAFNFVELAIELSVSGFAGLVIGMMCLSMEIAPMLALAISGVAGHAGGRTIILLERCYKRKLNELVKK